MVNVQRTPPIVAVPQSAAALPADANRFADVCNGREVLIVNSVHSAAAAFICENGVSAERCTPDESAAALMRARWRFHARTLRPDTG